MTAAEKLQSDGIVLIYNSVYPEAPVVRESVTAFKAFSAFPVFPVNAALGYPRGLDGIHFAAIVLHYTMFYGEFAPLTEDFRRHLATNRNSYKVAFFQDEQAYLPERIDFCREYGINLIYTCIEAPHAERVYSPSGAERVLTYLPGYVSRELAGQRPPPGERPIDIGYRGRKPPPSWTGAALEKYEIAERFRDRSAGLGLKLDIETSEEKRIYGDGWLRFIGECKAVLGTESGAAVADPEAGEIRTISPRHFEAAAMRSCQILYEGHYSGVMEPMTHFIPLRKDFSNFEEVVDAFCDVELRERLIENAHRDLIASGRFAYSAFVAQLDEELSRAGLHPQTDPGQTQRVSGALYPPRLLRRARRYRNAIRSGVRIGVNRLRGRPATDSLRSRGESSS